MICQLKGQAVGSCTKWDFLRRTFQAGGPIEDFFFFQTIFMFLHL